MAKVSRIGDVLFGGLTRTSGLLIVLLVTFIGVFLLAMALPTLSRNTGSFLTTTQWIVTDNQLDFGIFGLLVTTVISSLLAMAIAVPISIGIALFITQYAHKRLAGPIAFLVDLLAAVPSIIFGLWGLKVLAPALAPFSEGLQTHLGWFPLFRKEINSQGTVFIAGIVLAIMIIPIVTAISRDIFNQTPTDHKEAALALGATRWEVVSTVVLPHGRSGVISASMLGLGRALGETIAVMIILSAPPAGTAASPSLFAGGITFASKIALSANELDTATKTGAYVAAGLVLFLITFLVNATARIIAERGAVK
ncbi:phosphate ABC transporter permease subunit PstC [Propionibacteriaceae bacterium Y1685]